MRRMPCNTLRVPRRRLILVACISLALSGLAQAQSNEASPSAVSAQGNDAFSVDAAARGASNSDAQTRVQDDKPDAARLDEMEARLAQQSHQIDELTRSLAQQQRDAAQMRQQLEQRSLDEVRGTGIAGAAAPPQTPNVTDNASLPTVLPTVATQSAADGAQGSEPGIEPVGRPPEPEMRPPEVAQIFDQPGVLTPRGKFVLEPSFQYGYSSNDRVALVGFTIIPAIVIGLIDVRQVKTTSLTAALIARYGLTNRLELEVKVPYTYVNGDTVSREIFTGTAQDSVFNADGRGLGDVEATVRYQFNKGSADRPYYVGWLRYKSRTGTDLFEVVTDCVTRCVANATGTGLPLQLPTGSGFESLQPGVTWLYASDPVVFFGSLSYLHNFTRHNVSRTVLSGAPAGFPQTSTELIGDVKAGDIIGLNFGMGLALNEKAAISIGYDQNLVGKTKQNGEDTPGAVRLVLGTLLLGGSYRFSDRVSLNVALGIGVTRDTPDLSLAVRVPVTF